MLNLSLIGKDLKHSKSKEIYKQLLNIEFNYEFLDYESSQDIDFNRLVSFDGISVTSPYKNFAYKKSISSNLEDIQAVNCLKFQDGQLIGTNTDYLACLEIIDGYKANIDQVIILGSGSMANVISQVCLKKNISKISLSRKQKNLSDIVLYDKPRSLVINCCAREFNFAGLNIQKAMMWDLNYNQVYTEQLKLKHKDQFLDGESLLYKQAKFALQFWGIV